eukprot:262912-Chlamydomonas_euryale.AAC.1
MWRRAPGAVPLSGEGCKTCGGVREAVHRSTGEQERCKGGAQLGGGAVGVQNMLRRAPSGALLLRGSIAEGCREAVRTQYMWRGCSASMARRSWPPCIRHPHSPRRTQAHWTHPG